MTSACKIMIWQKLRHLRSSPLWTTNSTVCSLSCRQRKSVSHPEAGSCRVLWPQCCAKTLSKLTNRLTISPWETPQTRRSSRCTRRRQCFCLRDWVRCSSRRWWCCHRLALSSCRSIMSQKFPFWHHLWDMVNSKRLSSVKIWINSGWSSSQLLKVTTKCSRIAMTPPYLNLTSAMSMLNFQITSRLRDPSTMSATGNPRTEFLLTTIYNNKSTAQNKYWRIKIWGCCHMNKNRRCQSNAEECGNHAKNLSALSPPSQKLSARPASAVSNLSLNCSKAPEWLAHFPRSSASAELGAF